MAIEAIILQRIQEAQEAQDPTQESAYKQLLGEYHLLHRTRNLKDALIEPKIQIVYVERTPETPTFQNSEYGKVASRVNQFSGAILDDNVSTMDLFYWRPNESPSIESEPPAIWVETLQQLQQQERAMVIGAIGAYRRGLEKVNFIPLQTVGEIRSIPLGALISIPGISPDRALFLKKAFEVRQSEAPISNL